ncbi:peptidoglycan DD-metalloendopeptidase family protein [Pararhodobacter sp.]
MSRVIMTRRMTGKARTGVSLAVGAAMLAGCTSTNTLDWDLRPSNRFSTSAAVRQPTSARPAPDARGVISYPGYQVVVAGPGESVAAIAQRLGLAPQDLARHNAIEPGTVLRGGELLVLPSRVDDPTIAGSITATPLAPAMPAGPEPLRHTVRRGETAFTIARLYNVTPRSLAEWNGLAGDMGVREGQILMIPVVQAPTAGAPLSASGLPDAPAAAMPETDTSLPGQGSVTPTPPSASTPLPDSTPAPAGQGASAARPAQPVADLGAQRSEEPRLAMPVSGRIIRAYARGRNDGIGIGAPAGTEVRAADAGTVAAITQDTDQVPILVLRHANNLLTVYANIDDIRVTRGDTVSREQVLATVRRGDPSFLHFEVREGFESVDPMPYLQ